jgi:hypothetical protein
MGSIKDHRQIEGADFGRQSADPKEPGSTVLSVEEEAVVVAFRRHTLLAFDDCLAIPAARPASDAFAPAPVSKRHGIPRLPQVDPRAPKRADAPYLQRRLSC